MNCDDVLSTLETGGFAKRLRARWHLLRCRRCQQVNEQAGIFKQELSKIQPLDERHRELWMAAAQPDRANQGYQPVGVSARWAFAGLAVVIAMFTGIGIWLVQQDDSPQIVENDTLLPAVQVESDLDERIPGESGSGELDKIRSDFAELSKALDELSGMIELMDELKGVDDLLSRYAAYEVNKNGI